MAAKSESWRELTEFEHCEPTPLAFRALVALLDTWPDDDKAAAIDYADQLLSKWPDAVRLAPWSWCKAASKGLVLSTWKLVRALELRTNHLTKGMVDLARLAHFANLQHISELSVPMYSDFQELSFLYHRPETFTGLEKLRASDSYDDGEVRALADSPIWRTLKSFEINELGDSLVHRKDASRIVPHLDKSSRIEHLTLRSPDLIAVWEANTLSRLCSVSVIIRSVEEARKLAKRKELSQLTSLTIAFRCGFSGSSPFEPFLGNVIEADEAAAEALFSSAKFDKLEKLEIIGYRMGYWGREGMGRLELEELIASTLLQRLKHLRLELLPLGDKGVTALAPALGRQLETLELVDVYCKGEGAAALTESPCLSSLRHLDLSANRIDADHFARMARVDMPNLESLNLSGPGVNPYYWQVGQQPLLDSGAAAWAGSDNVKQLKSLKLSNCFLSSDALPAIFQSTKLGHLELLDLSHNAFTAAIAKAVVGSPLWNELKELALNNCRLGNEDIEALCQVNDAPKLRSLELGYNSIGPKGAKALANWPVLARVSHLNLHDNLIGDEGLIAFAESTNLRRLLELDLEQDCWNSRTFTFNDQAATALAKSKSLPRLDCLFSGCVDEYHGTAYSPGFTKQGLHAVRKSQWMRPACQAACSDFSGIDEYFDNPQFNEEAELDDHDFRRHPFALIDKEAAAQEHRMQQISSPSRVIAFDYSRPPEIGPCPEVDFDDEDEIEGIAFRDPTPITDHSMMLRLSLEDGDRPLPEQVGKFLSNTLGSIFRCGSLGRFETSGETSRVAEDGSSIPTDHSFSVRIKGEPESAIQLIREALWWVGAPEDTDLDEFRLNLAKEPESNASRFLQLAVPVITRWKGGRYREAGHRIDRAPFSKKQRQTIQNILTESNAKESGDGWLELRTGDGGCMKVFTKYLQDADDFDTLNILADALTPDTSALVHRLMKECRLMLFPMAFAASEEVAGMMDCDWPKVELVQSTESLHELLARGPYDWWRKADKRQ